MSARPEVVVLDSGSGNLRSVTNALGAAGAHVHLATTAVEIERARALVVPGQGAFGDCLAALRERSLDHALLAAFARGTPTLGICLGLQILFESSEEAPGVPGLGLLRGTVRRFRPEDPHDKVPHMGWNEVVPPAGRPGKDPLWPDPAPVHAYFVHSYFAAPAEPACVALECEYAGERFCAAARVGSVFATQFHPEKSQRVGLALLGRFVEAL
jgi:glutamine amidotransferase